MTYESNHWPKLSLILRLIREKDRTSDFEWACCRGSTLAAPEDLEERIRRVIPETGIDALVLAAIAVGDLHQLRDSGGSEEWEEDLALKLGWALHGLLRFLERHSGVVREVLGLDYYAPRYLDPHDDGACTLRRSGNGPATEPKVPG